MKQHSANFNFTRSDRAASIRGLIASKELTPQGGDYVTLALDPFHDFNRPIAGYPDADSFDTVVSVRNYEYTVSKPAGLAAGNWDAHIFTMPFDGTNFTNGTAVNGLFTQTTEAYSMGLVTVAKDAAGQPLFPTAVPVASADFSMTKIDNFSGVEDGMSRILGLGLEVIDVTANLSKQGSLVAYKMPIVNNTTTTMSYANTAGTVISVINPTVIMTPPATVADAILYRSSIQWEARDGAYMVVGPQGIDNPYTQPASKSLIVCDNPVLPAAVQALCVHHKAIAVANAAPALTCAMADTSAKMMNVAQQGIMITGLDNSAVFKIRVRVFVERAPMLGDLDLIPLATPSAPYDYKALALRSTLAAMLPVAVPVSFNAKGDWWRIIVNTIKKVIPVASNALSSVYGPEVGILGSAVSEMIPHQTVGAKKKPNNNGRGNKGNKKK